MSLRLLRMMVSDGLLALLRGRGLTAAALLIITLTFSVSALALLAAGNLAATVELNGRPGVFRVYFGEETPDSEAVELARRLRHRDGIASVTVVRAGQARDDFLAAFPEMSAGVDLLVDNPFPPHLEVTVADAVASARRRELRAALGDEEGVVAVLGDDLWTRRLLDLARLIRRAGLAAGLAFALAATLVVAGVTRLSLATRRDEIAVMWVVGAPRAFISGPFVVEGVVLGAGGALLAWAASWGVFRGASMLAEEHPLLGFLALAPLPASSVLFLVSCSVVAGTAGALLTVHQAARAH
ncbi:MAG: FtsX-like permease family protein [Acidobacteria bacterium]|nr:MAG: FtsX-like permease family protein [Acidobacteriota bacterium]